MDKRSNNDIYEYHFKSLFNKIKNEIGYSALDRYDKDTDYDEVSTLIFNVMGSEFMMMKARESTYKYWVEVYITKIIKNLLERKGIQFGENYYPDQNEQHSLTIHTNDKKLEVYFLYDITYAEPYRTDYDKIAKVLKDRSDGVEGIRLYIFRDFIAYADLANLVNNDPSKNESGFVRVYPLQDFFKSFLDLDEYSAFFGYAKEFWDSCNSILSYKTVLAPTNKTLRVFRENKAKMLENQDYKRLSRVGAVYHLSDLDFKKIEQRFLNKKMYFAMISDNDFADSFISAEWLYDVYSKSMGELELTGIIAGYLKSIEQLLYTIVRFHRDEGLRISVYRERRRVSEPYTEDNEQNIDSTLGSLNRFVTSKEGNLSISKSISDCISETISVWTKYQRNGYFHKDNLYRKENKISEVREMTIYLYFLLLGGINYRENEIKQLGVTDYLLEDKPNYNEAQEYEQFKRWMDGIVEYDLPQHVPGIAISLFEFDGRWELHPYIMKYFRLWDFEDGLYDDNIDVMNTDHLKDIPAYSWVAEDDSIANGIAQFTSLFNKYCDSNIRKFKNIRAIILETYIGQMLLYHHEE